MKKRYLEAARITKPVGLKGEMRAQLLCDGCEILTGFELTLGKEHLPVKAISAVPLKNDMCKIRLAGVETAEDAQRLAGKLLYLDRQEAELPEDTFFIADLIGLPVYDAESGKLYGKVAEILQNGPADVYVLKSGGGRELMFPAIPEVLKKIDTEAERIEITPLKGLFEDTEEV